MPPLKQNKVLAFHGSLYKSVWNSSPEQLNVPYQVLPVTSLAARVLNNPYKSHVSPEWCDV